jgi:hypothetical protein
MAHTQILRHCLILFWACWLSGCAHLHLQWNTVRQSHTLNEIYEQHNLAMFVYNPNSLASFAYPNQGSSDVMDHIGGSSSTTWDPHGFLQTVLGVDISRDATQAWTLTPVFDPRRLELMRCAYRQVVTGIGRDDRSECPDCDKIQRNFYSGSASGDDAATVTQKRGITTTACLSSRPWFHWGCKSDVPKDCKCIKVGHHCGVYVWVLRDGEDELAKLTLIILDYAFNTPTTPPDESAPTKDVTWYFDSQGSPTTEDKAVQVVRATVPFGSTIYVKEAAQQSKQEQQMVKSMLTERPKESQSTPIAPPMLNPLTPLQLQQYLQSLTPRR